MKTPQIPTLPIPPHIPRACCPDPEAKIENYWSCYLWKLNRCLWYPFSDMFLDMRYSNILFPDKTLDWGEMKYDATNFTINISGTDYDKAWCQIAEHTYNPQEDDFITLNRTATTSVGGTYTQAKTLYEDSPNYTTYEQHYLNWYAKYTGDIFGIEGRQLFNYYNTSDLVYVESAIIKVYATDVDLENTTVDSILRIYKYDYGDAVDENDYRGRTLIATRTFTSADVNTSVEMAISADDVTVGGESHYRFALGAMEDLSYFPQPATDETIQQYLRFLDPNGVKLVVQGC